MSEEKCVCGKDGENGLTYCAECWARIQGRMDENNAYLLRPRKDITSPRQIGYHHGADCTCPDCDPQ